MKDKGGASATADLTLRIAAILARSTRAESLPALLQAICEELDWDLGEAWLPVPDQELLQFRAAWHASPGVTDRWIEAGRGIALAPGHGLIGRVWTNGEPEWLEDIAHSEAFTRNLYAAEAGLNTACAFPFRAEGRVVGVGGLFCHEKREPDSALLRQLVAVGLQLGRVAESYEATLHSERYFLELTESTNDILAVIKIDGTIEYENAAVERVLGYQRRERIGRNVFDYIHPDDMPMTFDGVRIALQDPGSVHRMEVRARHRNGQWVWLESVGSVRVETTGPVLIVASRDISDRKRMQVSLNDSESRIRNLVNNSSIILFEIDRGGVISLSEGGALSGLGRKPGESVGSSVERVYQDVPRIPQIVELALSGETVSVELPVRKRWFKATCGPIYDESGVIVAAGGVAMDITEQKAWMRYVEGLNRLLEMVALGSPRDEVLSELAIALEESIEDSLCMVWALRAGRLELLASPNLAEAVAGELRKGVPSGAWTALRRHSAKGPDAVVSAPLTSDKAWKEALAPLLELGIVHVWSLAILGDDPNPLGLLDVYHLSTVDPKPFEEEYVEGAGRVARAAFLAQGTKIDTVGARVGQRAAAPKGKPRAFQGASVEGRRRGRAAQESLGLSDAQARILRLIARGLSNGEIARAVGLSPHTVKEYVSAISRSLGAKNRAHAVALAIDIGLA